MAEQPFDDDAITPCTVELAVAAIDAHPPEATAFMEGQACGVLGKNARHELPESARGIRLTERLQGKPARTRAARSASNIHGVFRHGIRTDSPSQPEGSSDASCPHRFAAVPSGSIVLPRAWFTDRPTHGHPGTCRPPQSPRG